MQVSAGLVTLRPLEQHLPVPAYWTIGTTATAIVVADYTSTQAASLEIWNRGSNDVYVNFNGVTATGPSGSSTDLHLAPGEQWSILGSVTEISALTTTGSTAVEVQLWA